jgi:hypothetical protein
MPEGGEVVSGAGSSPLDGAPSAHDSAAASEQKAHRGLLKSGRVVTLLALTLLFGLFAVLAFPTDAPVSAVTGQGEVLLESPTMPSVMNVYLSPLNSGRGTDLEVSLTSVAPIDQSPQKSWVRLNLILPTAELGPRHCPKLASTCLEASVGAKTVEWYFPRWKTYRTIYGATEWYDNVRVLLPSTEFTAISNAEYVAASLPNVVFSHWDGHSWSNLDSALPLNIAVTIPHVNNYTWTSGVAPVVGPNHATWGFNNPPGASQSVSGINLAVQDRDGKLLFLAGALLGIAGAALIGAVTEAIKS